MEGFDPKICLFEIEATIKIQDAILKMGVIGAMHSEVEAILEKSGIEMPLLSTSPPAPGSGNSPKVNYSLRCNPPTET